MLCWRMIRCSWVQTVTQIQNMHHTVRNISEDQYFVTIISNFLFLSYIPIWLAYDVLVSQWLSRFLYQRILKIRYKAFLVCLSELTHGTHQKCGITVIYLPFSSWVKFAFFLHCVFWFAVYHSDIVCFHLINDIQNMSWVYYFLITNKIVFLEFTSSKISR